MGVEYLVFLLAGFATGIITGLVGASAIVVFVPIILLFYNYSPFIIIGVSLAVDVFISLFAMIIYRKFHHIDFKTGFYLSILAVVGAIVGSYLSKFIPDSNLLGITALLISFTGVVIYRRKANMKEVHKLKNYSKTKFLIAIILSFFVGLVGGGFGAAGGIGILLLLILLLNFETHFAIGTSIFVMFFIALFGSAAHFYYVNSSEFQWILLLFAIVGGLLGSFFSSKLANAITEKYLNKIAGVILFILGIVTFLHKTLI